MGTGRAASRAHATNELPSRNRLGLGYVDVRQVAITSGKAASMINNNQLPVSILPTNEGHSTAGAGHSRVAGFSVDVLTGMKLIRTATERIPPSAETAFQVPHYGPD